MEATKMTDGEEAVAIIIIIGSIMTIMPIKIGGARITTQKTKHTPTLLEAIAVGRGGTILKFKRKTVITSKIGAITGRETVIMKVEVKIK